MVEYRLDLRPTVGNCLEHRDPDGEMAPQQVGLGAGRAGIAHWTPAPTAGSVRMR